MLLGDADVEELRLGKWRTNSVRPDGVAHGRGDGHEVVALLGQSGSELVAEHRRSTTGLQAGVWFRPVTGSKPLDWCIWSASSFSAGA